MNFKYLSFVLTTLMISTPLSVQSQEGDDPQTTPASQASSPTIVTTPPDEDPGTSAAEGTEGPSMGEEANEEKETLDSSKSPRDLLTSIEDKDDALRKQSKRIGVKAVAAGTDYAQDIVGMAIPELGLSVLTFYFAAFVVAPDVGEKVIEGGLYMAAQVTAYIEGETAKEHATLAAGYAKAGAEVGWDYIVHGATAAYDWAEGGV